MLYTDACPITIDDITSVDADILRIASVENAKAPINLQEVVEEATEIVANQIIGEFQNLSVNFGSGTTSYITTGYGEPNVPARVALGQIVIDDDTTSFASPLKRYLIYTAIRHFYSLASGRKDPKTDRYSERVKALDIDLRGKFWRNFRAAGLAIQDYALPAPSAKYELGTGSFTVANVIAGDGLTWDTATEQWDQEGAVFEGTQAGTYDVVVTWIRNDGAESYQSPTVTVPVLAGQVINLNIISLVPPNGVVSWNIYCGVQNGPLFFQANVSISTPFFAFTASPALQGTLIGRGQAKSRSLTFVTPFFRG